MRYPSLHLHLHLVNKNPGDKDSDDNNDNDDDDGGDDVDNDDDDNDDDIERRRVLIELLAAYIGRFINVSSEFRLSVFLRFLQFKLTYI